MAVLRRTPTHKLKTREVSVEAIEHVKETRKRKSSEIRIGTVVLASRSEFE
jgi:hypothetical protein